MIGDTMRRVVLLVLILAGFGFAAGAHADGVPSPGDAAFVFGGDDPVVFERAGTVTRGVGDYSWTGRDVRGFGLTASFAVRGDEAAGFVRTPSAAWRVTRDASGRVDFLRADYRDFSCGASDPPAPVLPSPPATTDDGSYIDVMVVYTPAFAAGAPSLVELAAQLAIDETNWSYEWSGITQRLRLVGVREINYVESGSRSTDLNRITATDDGYMDDVHAWRNEVGADLVGLWSLGEICGYGWIMSSVDVGFADHGFTSTDNWCVVIWGFAHEMGHNMGLRHDRYVDGTDLPYPYAHGYTFADSICARTIMAYNDYCEDLGRLPIPIPVWSNPDLIILGWAFGIPDTEPDPADNRKALNNTAWTVSNFRAHVCDCAVDGLCLADGDPNPDNPCEACDSASSPTAWSPASGSCDNGLFCDGTDSCVDGACAPTGQYPCGDEQQCIEETDECVDITDDDTTDDDTVDDDSVDDDSADDDVTDDDSTDDDADDDTMDDDAEDDDVVDDDMTDDDEDDDNAADTGSSGDDDDGGCCG